MIGSFHGAVTEVFSRAKSDAQLPGKGPRMDDEAQLPAANRLEALGYQARRKKPEVLKALTPKMKLLIDYVVNGCPHDYVRQLTRPAQQVDPATGGITTIAKPIEPGEPLTLIEAADVLRIRRRQARDLFKQPLFARHLAQEIQALRDGQKSASLHRMIDLRDDPGQGKAADRKVQLQAAQALLGEGEGNRPSVSVIVKNQTIQPGYVIRIRDEPEPRTIEATTTQECA
ncbi:MAG: hypothetical protein ACHQAY_06765 [Hyphomicrobiales bacterium]